MVWLLKLTSSVYPSGGDFATAAAARLPPAPGLFSTRTGCFSEAAIGSAMKRAIVSVVPPGGAPTTNLIGRAGKSSARGACTDDERTTMVVKKRQAPRDFTCCDLFLYSLRSACQARSFPASQ